MAIGNLERECQGRDDVAVLFESYDELTGELLYSGHTYRGAVLTAREYDHGEVRAVFYDPGTGETLRRPEARLRLERASW